MNSVIKKKRKARNLPMVTVVTVVLNGAEHVESTIRSVIGQDYPDIEYLIMDGGSTDGTLDIIKRHKASIAGIISEPDNGLYDAMNKAAAVAKGEWILFMNAGDTFYSAACFPNFQQRLRTST
jgi:glycosyltransferase involved in cell wall biosynthesis